MSSYDCESADDVLKAIKDDKIEMVDLRFADLPGLWQHFSVPPRAFNLDSFAEGVGFDGSSIRGFQEIQESDMMVVPDPATALDEEIEKIRIESFHSITIDTFVPRSEIDDRYIDDPYYRAHRPGRRRGICRYRDAIRDKGMVALGRMVRAFNDA
jgi:glutamine synthetase